MDSRTNTMISHVEEEYQAAASVDGYHMAAGRSWAGQQPHHTQTPSQYSTVDVYKSSVDPYLAEEGPYISSQQHREGSSPVPSVAGYIFFTLFFIL